MSWRQHPTRHQLYGHLPPITETIQVRQTRHAGHCWRSRDELISDVLLWSPHMAEQKQDDQHEHTFSNYVRIQDIVQKACQRRLTIGKSVERGSGISVIPARHHDDDDDSWFELKVFLRLDWLLYQGKKSPINPCCQHDMMMMMMWRGNSWIHAFPKVLTFTLLWTACQTSWVI